MGLTKPIEQNLLSYQGTFMYLKNIIRGENDVVESNMDQSLSVKVENGDLLALGSANPRTVEQYSSDNFMTYYGKMQAVVHSNEMGTLKINVSGEKLQTVTASINVAPII